jgi:CheY-like chemotaxis protein
MMSLSPSPVASPQPPGRRRILLVEADPAAQEVLREQLHGMGHPVIVAAGLAEATSLLATLHVDLVLADALLAGVDAPPDARWAALARLRALAGGAPVLLAAARPELVADWRERGFAALLRKPYERIALLVTVARYLPPAR